MNQDVTATSLAAAGQPCRYAATEPPAQRPTWAEIDLAAIRSNVAMLKEHAAAPRLLAAVKADGYGHGLVQAASAAIAGGAQWLGVALVEEGRSLRDAGITVPILLFTQPPVGAIPALLDAGLTPAVYTAPFVEALEREAAARETTVAVHLKLDTGMRRVGVPQADWADALRWVRASRNLHLEGLWSHLAVADDPENPFTLQQAHEFQRGVELARAQGHRPQLLHLCNSAGTLWLHDHHHDMVRTGVSMYGLQPSSALRDVIALRPAMSWWSRLSLVKSLAAGEGVSYGLRWAARQATTVGTVPAGYADGVPRRLTNRGQVVVRGQRRDMVGTVCMDQFLIDGGGGELAVGDDVALIGEQDGVSVSADDWAAWLDTINYEVVCAVGRRVPRVYPGDGDGPA